MTKCECWPTPENMQFNYYGAIEPGSALEYNPDCPQHGKGWKPDCLAKVVEYRLNEVGTVVGVLVRNADDTESWVSWAASPVKEMNHG